MIKVFFISSESNNSFGINQVLISLKTFLGKKCIISSSKNFYNFLKSKYDIIHIHGCWSLSIFFYFLLSKAINVKVIISPHGMLDPYSLNQKKFIKLIFWHLLQKYIFKYSNQIIVNSLNEKRNILQIIKHPCVVIIPHGIRLDKIVKKKITYNNKNLKFVFFSRIHHVKNLDKLIDIWTNNNNFKNFHLSLYGEISNYKYFNLIKNKILKHKNIKYHGPLNKNKIKILSKYDVFIFPSKSENFGLVVLEALAAGLYVILNKKLPWKDIANKGFATLINFNNNSLLSVVKKLNKSRNKLRNYNYLKNTHIHLNNNYNWHNISNLYLLNYKKNLK